MTTNHSPTMAAKGGHMAGAHGHIMSTTHPGSDHHHAFHNSSLSSPPHTEHVEMVGMGSQHLAPGGHHNVTSVHNMTLGDHMTHGVGTHDSHMTHGVGTHDKGADGGGHDAHGGGGHEGHLANAGNWAAILNFGNTSSPSPCGDSYYCLAEQVTVITIPILIIIGNIITISVLLRTKSFRNCHGYYLLSLAVADLLMGPAAMAAVYPVFHHYWPFGVTGCFFTAYTAEVCMKVSLLMLVCLSVERYIAICHPFHYTRIVTTRTTAAAIAASWVSCNLIYIVTIPTELMCFTFEEDKYLCTVTYFLHPEYVIGVVLAFLLPSLLVVTATNSVTSLRIFKREFGSSQLSAGGKVESGEMRVHSKKNTRVFRVLVCILVVFYVCWIPYVSLHIYAYASGNTWDLNHYLEFYTFWIAISNSCLNPMIYFGMNRTFKRATIAIVKNAISKVTLGAVYGGERGSIADTSMMEIKSTKSSLRLASSVDGPEGIDNPVFIGTDDS